MNYRESIKNDISGILSLQEKNLVTNLSDGQKKNGFVTTPFTNEQLEKLIAINGLFVIENENRILGYVIAAGWDYFRGRPMFDFMIDRFSKMAFCDIQIGCENSFQYGPICIDEHLRGTDCFLRLFETMKQSMSDKYAIGLTFINKVNERSYLAHTKKANLIAIDDFAFSGNAFYGLAFLTTDSQADQQQDKMV